MQINAMCAVIALFCGAIGLLIDGMLLGGDMYMEVSISSFAATYIACTWSFSVSGFGNFHPSWTFNIITFALCTGMTILLWIRAWKVGPLASFED